MKKGLVLLLSFLSTSAFAIESLKDYQAILDNSDVQEMTRYEDIASIKNDEGTNYTIYSGACIIRVHVERNCSANKTKDCTRKVNIDNGNTFCL